MGDRDNEAKDTLKSVYTQFRSTFVVDEQSDDIVAVIVPGETRDLPTNEGLAKCYKSLRSMVPKHQDPKIGTIEVVQTDGSSMLKQQVFMRKVEHHFLFTYQTPPDSNQTRKRMRYLSGGHSAINTWPVPDTPRTQRLQTTQEDHDDLVSRMKQLQRDSHEGNLQWWAYCDSEGFSSRHDPQTHAVDIL